MTAKQMDNKEVQNQGVQYVGWIWRKFINGSFKMNG